MRYLLIILSLLFWGCDTDNTIGSGYEEGTSTGGDDENNYDPAHLSLYSNNLYKSGSAIIGSITIKNDGELTANNSEASVYIHYNCYNNLQDWDNTDHLGNYNLGDIEPNNTESISVNHTSTCSSDGNGWLNDGGFYPTLHLDWD